MACEVNHKINPDKRSKRESNVEAITANDLLSIEAKTFAAKSTKLAMFDTWTAILSLRASCSISSWEMCALVKILCYGKPPTIELLHWPFSYLVLSAYKIQKIIRKDVRSIYFSFAPEKSQNQCRFESRHDLLLKNCLLQLETVVNHFAHYKVITFIS